MSLLTKKSWLKSRTLAGVAITAFAPYAPAVLTAVGFENAPALVTAVTGLVGSALATYGRFKAVKALV